MKQLFSLLFLSFAAACGSSSSSSNGAALETTNGVNDVTKACQIRATWANASARTCSTCVGLAIAPHCPCEDEPYAARCNDQQAAMNAEPSCADVAGCVGACRQGDCACVDACYAGKDACRTRAAAVDGCVAEVCDSYCR